MSNKITAVEWLYDKIKSHFEHDGDLLESFMMTTSIAKQKEREQMIDFAKYCSQHTDYVTSYEDCYTQTYGECTQQ